MNPILHDLKQFLNTSVPISKNIFTQTIEHIYNIQDNSQEIKYLHKLSTILIMVQLGTF